MPSSSHTETTARVFGTLSWRATVAISVTCPKGVTGLSKNRSEGHVGSLDAGTGFVVDPAGLDVIATALQGAREEVIAIMVGLRRLPEGSRSVLGEEGAQQAYTNFFDAWVSELETTAGGLAELADRMHAVAMTYRNTDQMEKHRFGAVGLPGSTPSPDPDAVKRFQ